MSEQYTYFVEFIDHDGIQRPIYLRGQSNEHIKAIMDDYDIVVIDNTEMPENCWHSQLEGVNGHGKSMYHPQILMDQMAADADGSTSDGLIEMKVPYGLEVQS